MSTAMTDMSILDAELARLNKAVKDAIKDRTDWMDAHMADYAKHKVGDKLYNLDTGAYVGTIAELYRYWGDGRDVRYDYSMSIDYRFEDGGNTSSAYGTIGIGTAEEAAERLRWRAKSLTT